MRYHCAFPKNKAVWNDWTVCRFSECKWILEHPIWFSLFCFDDYLNFKQPWLLPVRTWTLDHSRVLPLLMLVCIKTFFCVACCICLFLSFNHWHTENHTETLGSIQPPDFPVQFFPQLLKIFVSLHLATQKHTRACTHTQNKTSQHSNQAWLLFHILSVLNNDPLRVCVCVYVLVTVDGRIN